MKITKKLIGIILLCGVLCASGCEKTQSEPETTQPVSETVALTEQATQEPAEKGLAKKVEVDYGEGTAVYEFNEKGLLVSEKNNPWREKNIYYAYDGEDRITEITYDDYNDSGYKSLTKVTYEYGTDGKVLKSSTYNLPENELVGYCDYEYSNGVLAKKSIYDKYDGEFIFQYTEEFIYRDTQAGREVTHRMVYNDGSVDESTNIYDESGRLISEIYSPGAGSTDYIYDENGRLIKEVYGSDEQEKVYEYDENGLVIKAVWTKDEFYQGESNKKGEYEVYENYDNGNIALVRFYDKNGEQEHMVINIAPEVKGNYNDIREVG